MNWWQRRKRDYRLWQSRQQSAISELIQNSSQPCIVDGVDYRQPPIVPGPVRAQGATAVKNHLTESREYYQGQFDPPNRSSASNPVTMPLDDPLAEWDYNTRRAVLENCHAAYHRNPLAKRAVDVTRQFAVGKGHTVTAQNQDVQAIIDEFRANPENNILGYDRGFVQDLQIDGELFIRFFNGANGQVVIVPIPPWHIPEICCAPGFFRRILHYHLSYTWTNPNDNQGEILPIDEEIAPADMLHVAINNHTYELRGRPDLFVILPWLKAYHDWIEDRYRQNKWRGALLWWVKVAGAAPGAIAQKVTQWKKPPTPGSAYVSSDKEEVQALTNPVAANDASEDGRQIKLMVAVGVGLPEFMLSDGQNSNLASATAQQMPALWKFVDAQQLMQEQVWEPVYRRVIQAAIDAGRLPEMVIVQDADGDPVEGQTPIKAVECFKVEYPELQSDDPKTVSEALAIDLSGGLVSRETARGLKGYDHLQETKRIQKEAEEDRDNPTVRTPEKEGLVWNSNTQQWENPDTQPTGSGEEDRNAEPA
jgi:hypothetical protein